MVGIRVRTYPRMLDAHRFQAHRILVTEVKNTRHIVTKKGKGKAYKNECMSKVRVDKSFPCKRTKFRMGVVALS
jgi:hypothetical protein